MTESWHINLQHSKNVSSFLFIDTIDEIWIFMSDQQFACVYDGKEYIMTGRSAVKKKTNAVVVELRPKFNGGFGDDLNIWVSPTELYQIEEPDNE